MIIEALGAERCVAIGNGLNDRLLLRAAALGIAVVQREAGHGDTSEEAIVRAARAGLATFKLPKIFFAQK